MNILNSTKKVGTVATDKSGTLTIGKPTLNDILFFFPTTKDISDEKILQAVRSSPNLGLDMSPRVLGTGPPSPPIKMRSPRRQHHGSMSPSTEGSIPFPELSEDSVPPGLPTGETRDLCDLCGKMCNDHPRSCIKYVTKEKVLEGEEYVQWMALWWFIREAELNIPHPLARGLAECAGSILNSSDINELQSVGEQEFMPGVGVRLKFEHTVEILEFNGANLSSFLEGREYHNKIDSFVMNWVEEQRKFGFTVLGFWFDSDIQAILSMSDKTRPHARDFVQMVFQAGIDIRMVTGDNTSTALAFAKSLGLPGDHVFAQLDPVEKARIIKHLRSGTPGNLVMLGDGINDIAALSEADIGISFGCPTNMHMVAADVIFLGVDALNIIGFFFLMEAAQKYIFRNIVWAYGFNIVTILAAAGVFWQYGLHLTPEIGALLMAVSSITLILHSSFLFVEAKTIKNKGIKQKAKERLRAGRRDDVRIRRKYKLEL